MIRITDNGEQDYCNLKDDPSRFMVHHGEQCLHYPWKIEPKAKVVKKKKKR